MGSQFVDLNADGHVDYLTATFDGSPHIAYGSATGFSKPEHLKDANGERILIAYIWNYDKGRDEVLGRALDTDDPPSERCISALAFDWDADGDYDLLLGSYENGHLYRQMNEGSNSEPKFTGKNIPVMAGDEAFALPTDMTTPRLVDWDGDGDLDLVAGSFGDIDGEGRLHPDGKGGGVYLSRNGGEKGKPAFGALETLIPPSAKEHCEPTRPDVGLYPEVVDYDGDGDIDLVVGGYSWWTPKPPRELSADESAAVAKLRAEQKELRIRQTRLRREIGEEIDVATAGMQRTSDEARAKSAAIHEKYRDKTWAFFKENRELSEKLEKLVPPPQRQSFVWFYERL